MRATERDHIYAMESDATYRQVYEETHAKLMSVSRQQWSVLLRNVDANTFDGAERFAWDHAVRDRVNALLASKTEKVSA